MDRRVTNPSFDAGARLIPTGTYRLGEQLRRDREPAPLDPLLTEIFQVLLREKYKVVSAMQRVYPEVHPIINMHGVDTSPYRGPHASVSQATRYHEDMIAKCLSSTFPHRHIPLLYELIPTLEEACVIAHLCKQYCWKVVISLYIKRNPEGKICIQNTDGRLIPVVRALRQVEEVADISRAWYAFNCFDPRLTEGLIQTLKSS